MVSSLNCSVCSAPAVKLKCFYETAAEKVFIFKCSKCKLEFLSPQPSDALLKAEYERYFIRRMVRREFPKHEYFRTLLSILPTTAPKCSFLDIGAGEGYLSALLSETFPNSQISALEPGPIAEAFLCKRAKLINMNLEEWLELKEKQNFDVIFAMDVLEHLRNPMEAVQRLVNEHLNSGGLMIATFPNAASLSRRICGSFWPHYKLEHLFYFSPDSIRVIAESSELSTCLLRPLKKNLPMEYFLQVASEFGPKVTRTIARFSKRVSPNSFSNAHVNLPSGELLWIAYKTQENFTYQQ